MKTFAQCAFLGDEGPAVLTKREFFASHDSEVAHQRRTDDEGNGSSQHSTYHTKSCTWYCDAKISAGGENEQPVEEDIEQAKPDIQYARNVHIAATTEHTSTERVQHRERYAHREEHEVETGIVADVWSST